MTPEAPDPLFGALRYPQDAAQVIRAIEAMIVADPAFGGRFAEAVLDGAERAGTEPDRVRDFRRANPIPGELECTRGAHLFSAEGKLTLGWRTNRLGTVDLRLAGTGDFALNIDARLHGNLDEQERWRYRRSGEPLIAILTEPAPTADRLLERSANWLGTVAWDELLEPLAAASRSAGWSWLMATLRDELYGFEGGDLGADWRSLLDATRAPLLALVREVVASTAPGIQPEAAASYAGPTAAVTDGGELCIQVPDRPEGWVFVSLSGRTSQPTLRVAWEPLGSSKALRATIQALRASDPLYELSKHGIARRRPLDQPSAERLLTELRPHLNAFSEAGLLTGAPRRTG